ncbi:MAG: type II toxin-antitoxin system Phd/YefM family antitoxin [Bryobacteraceae bacterium]|jgi:prevent-host-death family protein
MYSWPVQDSKARFSELLDASVDKGPQIVTRRGVETAVMVPIEEWRRLKAAAPPDIKTLLLRLHHRFENLIPPHRKFHRRTPVDLQ